MTPIMEHSSNYDKSPRVVVPYGSGQSWRGWEAIGGRLRQAVGSGRPIVVTVDCYPGTLDDEVMSGLVHCLTPGQVIRSTDAFRDLADIECLVQPFLGDDPVFGYMNGLVMSDFFNCECIAALRHRIEAASGTVLVYGPGAALIHPGDILIYADITRWEGQIRQRRGQVDNLGTCNRGSKASLQYKRGFFVDWRVADRHKRTLWPRIDYILDANTAGDPKLATGSGIRAGLRHVTTGPFRVVPFFDPAPWGGRWMQRVCDLDPAIPNFGWCFDGVPEENSLLLGMGDITIELPALDLVFQQPGELLGDPVHGRFGLEFPIRFDFLDTMGGGNLSLQVHPITEYIQEHFGMHYTQDESYYILDAMPDACVYLGVKNGIDGKAMFSELAIANGGGAAFDPARYVNRWPARKHDHFLIPGGTLHCSGGGAMVLEISATPYIFTFKLWDWGRLGLDGNPRPVHLDHGRNVLQLERDAAWVQRHLINRVAPLATGPGWQSERTGLHEREFIETVRHWFTSIVYHNTGGQERGSVHMLNLVAGDDAVVSSPNGAFAPFTVHYAETFIVPAAVGSYAIAPGPRAIAGGQTCATICASVR